MASIHTWHSVTPIGRILAACHEEQIVKIALPAETEESFYEWLRNRFPESAPKPSNTPSLAALFAQLSSYFEKRLQKFDLAIEFWGSDFQKEVWKALLGVGYGQVISYGELARRLEKPAAVRAVGSANGANPLPIIVPCHRVIGQDGRLVGYGGGLKTKAWLLRLEAQQHLLPLDFGSIPDESANTVGIRPRLRSRSTNTDQEYFGKGAKHKAQPPGKARI